MTHALPDPATLLGDLDRPAFLARYWQRFPLYRRGTPARFAGLFGSAALPEALRQCERLKISRRDLLGRPLELPCAPQDAQAAFDGGATVCLSGLQGNPQLDAFLAAFARWLPQAGELSFNCYWSPDGQGFGLHLDDHPVWLLQLEGRKRWRYSRAPFPNVLGTATFAEGVREIRVPWREAPIARPPDNDFEEVVLEPGDVLYLPEGCWHRAAAEGSSLALTLACNRATPLDLVQQVLGPRLAGLPALQCNLSGVATAEVLAEGPAAAGLDEALEAAVQVLRESVAQLSAQELRQALLQRARRSS